MNNTIAFSPQLDRRVVAKSVRSPQGGYSHAPWHQRFASVFTDYFFGFVLALLLAILLTAAAQGATPLTISTTMLPNATVGTAYSQTLVATAENLRTVGRADRDCRMD